MSTVVSPEAGQLSAGSTLMDRPINPRAEALALRLEQGARALADFAATLTEAEWRTPIPHDGRRIGIVVHHVASVYPVEIHLAQVLASGQRVTGVVWDDVHAMNAQHAAEFAEVTKDAALELLRANAAVAAAAIRALRDEQLDLAAPASLYSDAPITCQFMLEDHAVRHSYHHLAKIRATLGR
jgi:mycothiol maleylpyruvate isomerase-like protein